VKNFAVLLFLAMVAANSGAAARYGLEREGEHAHPTSRDVSALDGCLREAIIDEKAAQSRSTNLPSNEDAIAVNAAERCGRPLVAEMRNSAHGEAQEIDEEEFLELQLQQRAVAIERGRNP
jgi:hypothetical protein